MTVQQLDDALKAWRSRLSAVAENLLELQTDLTYQSLTGTGGLERAEVSGATAARCEPALRAVNDLFRQFGLLQATVDRVEAIRKELPSFFGSEVRLQEAHQLLFARSVEVEADNVPLTARQLDGEARLRVRLTPEELLARMTASFAAVRDAVATVGAGWATCGSSLEAIEAERDRVRSQTALPSHLLAPALEQLAALLETAREQMRKDPLGATAFLRRQAEPAVARLHERIHRAAQVRSEVRGAEAVWRDVQGVHERARKAAEEAQQRFGARPAEEAVVEESKVKGLGEWLRRLEHHAAEGSIEPVVVGLKHWKAAAEACRKQDDAVAKRCSAALSASDELRGRMGALAAKARQRGITDSVETQELQSAAENLLHMQPMDLHRAAAAVAAFERRLRREVPRATPEAGIPTV